MHRVQRTGGALGSVHVASARRNHSLRTPFGPLMHLDCPQRHMHVLHHPSLRSAPASHLPYPPRNTPSTHDARQTVSIDTAHRTPRCVPFSASLEINAYGTALPRPPAAPANDTHDTLHSHEYSLVVTVIPRGQSHANRHVPPTSCRNLHPSVRNHRHIPSPDLRKACDAGEIPDAHCPGRNARRPRRLVTLHSEPHTGLAAERLTHAPGSSMMLL